jgi:hypothetical protein
LRPHLHLPRPPTPSKTSEKKTPSKEILTKVNTKSPIFVCLWVVVVGGRRGRRPILIYLCPGRCMSSRRKYVSKKKTLKGIGDVVFQGDIAVHPSKSTWWAPSSINI